jgi:signal transduction histidine kinase
MKLTIEDEVAKARAEAVENMMAMFAHQFRGAVGSIRFNAENQNDATIYIRLAQSMSGLLETFRIVSTTPEILADSFKSDCRGENSVECVLLQTIELVLAELLSKSSRPKISPYYRVFAQRNGLAPQAVSQSEWSGTKVWTTLEAELEAKWESEFSALVGSQDFAKLRRWLTEHFLPVQLNGFEASPIRFAEYGPKASLLTIVFAEMVANAIKYSIAGATGPITLSWNADTSNVTFTCTNPSTMETRQRAKSKGSGRGHKFLTIIANNLKGRFVSDVQRETSSSSFSFPSELVGANNE